MVGKYTQLHDAYLSVVEALKHGGIACKAKVEITWIDSEELNEKNLDQRLYQVDGILVPGGFGGRGTEGMILAAQYARVHKIPYLGICLGMQMAIVEFARHVLGYEDANSIELAPETTNPVIALCQTRKMWKILEEPCALEVIHVCLQMVLYPWNFSDRKKFRNVTDIVMKLTMHIAKNWQKKA